MAMINFNWRVHFGDDILEEALQAELEKCEARRVLLVAERAAFQAVLGDRVMAGLPQQVARCDCYPLERIEAASDALPERLVAMDADAVVAFGTARAILATQQALRGTRMSARNYPFFIAVPGVDGLPSVSDGFRAADTHAPSAVIFDPTLVLGESVARTAASGIEIITGCLEAQMSPVYNPPADGIALDGLLRVVTVLPDLMHADTMELRREMMAASLNRSLLRPKGPGPSERICEALTRNGALRVEPAALKGVFLRALAEMVDRTIAPPRRTMLRAVFGDPGEELGRAMSRFVAQIPVPATLKDLDLNVETIEKAAGRRAECRALVAILAAVLPADAVSPPGA